MGPEDAKCSERRVVKSQKKRRTQDLKEEKIFLPPFGNNGEWIANYQITTGQHGSSNQKGFLT